MRNKEMIEDYYKISDAIENFYDKHCYTHTIFEEFNKYYAGPQQPSESERKLSVLKLNITKTKLELIKNGEIKCCIHDLLETIEDYIGLLDVDGYVNCKYYLIKTLLGENDKEEV